MRPRSSLLLIGGVPVVLLALAACGAGTSTTNPEPASSGAATGTIPVTLQEWAIIPESETTAAGDITFQVTNSGPEDEHEFVVLRTDLDPGALPTDETGTVTEEGEDIVVVDEIEDIPVGETQELTVPLTAGNYVLLCNIYDETEDEAHYTLGMRLAFTVTE